MVTTNYESSKITAEKFFEIIKAEMVCARITDPVFQCMILAMAEQESIARNGPTSLARAHFNLFGFKGIKGYPTVTFPPNQFESEPQVYTRFPSYAKCFNSVLYAIFRSKHYAAARAKAQFAFSEGLDQRVSMNRCRRAWCTAWILTAGPTWAPPNPGHGKQVLSKFERWLDRLKVEGI